MDISVVLGYPSVSTHYQAGEADRADSEHARPAFDDTQPQHAPRDASTSAGDSWSARDAAGQYDDSDRYTPSDSPEYRATSPGFSFSRYESDSEASGAFSPQYEVTSPSYSPRGTQDGAADKTTAPAQPIISAAATYKQPASAHFAPASDAASHGRATTESASAGQGSCDVPAQAFKVFQNAAASPQNADTARPSTARGRSSTQQRNGRSAFCFARPTFAPAAPETHAASAGEQCLDRAQVSSRCQAPAEEANQCPAAGVGTHPENAHLHATAHHSAAVLADAVLSELACKLQQAEAVQAEAAQADAVVKEGLQTGGLQEEAVQAEARYTQTDGVPSAHASQAVGCNADATSTFVWGPSEAFASNGCGSSFLKSDAPNPSVSVFKAGGSSSSPKQPKTRTKRKIVNRR